MPLNEQSQRIEELTERLRTEGLSAEDELGREGLESSFEPLLRGRRGFKRTVKGEPWHWEYVAPPRKQRRPRRRAADRV